MKLSAILTLTGLMFSLIGFSSAQASFQFDGCYQMYLPNVMYPAFCLIGTSEEGIGGSGARLVIFSTNSDQILACGKSTSLDFSSNSLKFIQNGTAELILRNLKTENLRLEGDATLGKTNLKFIQISPSESQHLMDKFYDEVRCQNLQAGELKKLK